MRTKWRVIIVVEGRATEFLTEQAYSLVELEDMVQKFEKAQAGGQAMDIAYRPLAPEAHA